MKLPNVFALLCLCIPGDNLAAAAALRASSRQQAVIVVSKQVATLRANSLQQVVLPDAASDIKAADIRAFYINMPDRPQRAIFAEEQYHNLGIRASRIEGTAKPDKLVGGLIAWLRAVDACANEASVVRYCLIAEDDAVYRPIDDDEARYREKHGYPAWGKANTTADANRFFPALTAAVAALPGGADGSWSGMHLCTLGEMITLPYAKKKEIVDGSPWPNERFSMHKIYPGAPDVLLLRSHDVHLYRSKLANAIKDVQATNAGTPIDVLQSQLYTAEDAATAAGAKDTIKVFAADNPQLCQHLTDLSNDAKFRSSVGDGASARNPGSYTNKWGN